MGIRCVSFDFDLDFVFTVTDLSSGARRCFFHGKFVNAYGEEMPVACALHWHKEQNCIISTTQILR